MDPTEVSILVNRANRGWLFGPLLPMACFGAIGALARAPNIVLVVFDSPWPWVSALIIIALALSLPRLLGMGTIPFPTKPEEVGPYLGAKPLQWILLSISEIGYVVAFGATGNAFLLVFTAAFFVLNFSLRGRMPAPAD